MNPLSDDLNYILKHTSGVWEDLKGANLFITGGTGFFGCWLLESLIWANRQLGTNIRISVLTRDPLKFKEKVPHLACDEFVFLVQGDVRHIIDNNVSYTHIIHAAADVDERVSARKNIVLGMKNILDLVSSPKTKFLFVSSGAVYGPQPENLESFPEGYLRTSAARNKTSAYGCGKREAELILLQRAKKIGFNATIARCFAFFGPYMPFDGKFAAGNFMRDALNGGPIVLKGNGREFRSYLYAADLAIWLLNILVQGRNKEFYHVGSNNRISIFELARTLASCFEPRPKIEFERQEKDKFSRNYVPRVKRATQEFNLPTPIQLREGILKTQKWVNLTSGSAIFSASYG